MFFFFKFLNLRSRYNNETYRIDDIDWDRSPMSTFDKTGEQVSLVQYYRCVQSSSGALT